MYQFHFLDGRGGVPVLDFFDCADDGAATRTGGEQLSLHPSCVGVDVYDGERLVARLGRAMPANVLPGGTATAHHR